MAKKSKKPDMTEIVSGLDSRADEMYKKVERQRAEVARYKKLMHDSRTSMERDRYKQMAVQSLRQLKQLESQYQMINGQSFQLQNAQMMTQQIETTAQTVQAMAQFNKDMKKQMKKTLKKFDIGRIERMRDQMEDM
ncbi:Snf7 family protein, partial [Kipferlia bialata]|eukprot:g10326.t1